MVQLILQMGADLEARTDLGHTPFLRAVQNGDIETILCLLNSGADINTKANEGSTALHVAVRHGNEAALVLLLNIGGISVNSVTDGDLRVCFISWNMCLFSFRSLTKCMD